MQVDAENVALQQQLLALGGEVVAMERSMRDVAALNQMFSAQVLHQSEQIEQLYSEVRSLREACCNRCIGRHEQSARALLRTNPILRAKPGPPRRLRHHKPCCSEICVVISIAEDC